jgi:hypothetical protein
MSKLIRAYFIILKDWRNALSSNSETIYFSSFCPPTLKISLRLINTPFFALGGFAPLKFPPKVYNFLKFSQVIDYQSLNTIYWTKQCIAALP